MWLSLHARTCTVWKMGKVIYLACLHWRFWGVRWHAKRVVSSWTFSKLVSKTTGWTPCFLVVGMLWIYHIGFQMIPRKILSHLVQPADVGSRRCWGEHPPWLKRGLQDGDTVNALVRRPTLTSNIRSPTFVTCQSFEVQVRVGCEWGLGRVFCFVLWKINRQR